MRLAVLLTLVLPGLTHAQADSATRAVSLTIGGQVRARVERVSNYLAEAGAGRTDTYGNTRLVLSADLRLLDHLRLFAEARDAVGYDRDLSGGRRTSDHDRWDAQSLFVEGRGTVGGAALSARVGRQELAVGRERLVGPSDWSNARRAFDGARAGAALRGVALDLFHARPVAVRSSERNRADVNTSLGGATLGGRARGATWLLYALRLAQDSVAFAGSSGRHARVTTGARVDGTLPSPAWLPLSAELEGAVQRGSIGARDVRAWFGVAELTARPAALPWKTALVVGAEVASGDTDARDAVAGTFHQLLPSAHSHGGAMDIIGRQNTRELRAAVAATPVKRLSLRLAGHRFDRTSVADAAYGKAGTALRPVGASGARALGHELDLTATWQVARGLRALGGYGHFAPGRHLRDSAAATRAADWGFIGTTFTF